MSNKEPTKEQIKELWEWCGFRLLSGGEWCEAPDRQGYTRRLPLIDLNNLFKYVMPKLTLIYFRYNELNAFDSNLSVVLYEDLTPKSDKPIYKSHQVDSISDPALALFWAIWEVVHNA